MALGGGTWIFQNKVLPGAYINFKSKVRASVDMVDRGYCAMPIELDWGPESQVFTVEAENFQTDSLKYFGHSYAEDELKGLRDLFLHAKTVHFYRLSNGAAKAKGALGTAKYGGTRGNDITVTVAANVDETDKFDVNTYVKVEGVRTIVDTQTVSDKNELVDNDFVRWTKPATSDATKLEPVLADVFTGGTNGDQITSQQHQDFLATIEPYYYNTLGVVTTDQVIRSLYVSFVKRMRDDVGMKFQLVVYDEHKADYEGVISTPNKVTDSGCSLASMVYWLTGAEASCAVNASCTNMTYDGEFTVDTTYSQTELKRGTTEGQLMFHRVTDPTAGDVTGEVNVLDDINTFTSFSKQKNEDFSENQVIRVLDQIAIDVARMFNRHYLGKEQNDTDGRTALWGDLVDYYEEFQRIRAIQNFKSSDLPVPQQGASKGDVLSNHAVQPVCCMKKLYVTVNVA